MTAAEAMQEIAECSCHGTLDGVCNLGELWYEGEPSDANSHWVLESRCVEPETARRYIIGWLHDWWVEIADSIADVDAHWDVYSNVVSLSRSALYLSALWAAYKDVNKIEVG